MSIDTLYHITLSRSVLPLPNKNIVITHELVYTSYLTGQLNTFIVKLFVTVKTISEVIINT